MVQSIFFSLNEFKLISFPALENFYKRNPRKSRKEIQSMEREKSTLFPFQTKLYLKSIFRKINMLGFAQFCTETMHI